jgi:hypothetical protein
MLIVYITKEPEAPVSFNEQSLKALYNSEVLARHDKGRNNKLQKFQAVCAKIQRTIPGNMR